MDYPEGKEPLTGQISDRDADVLESVARSDPEAFFRMIEGGYISFEAIVAFLNRRRRQAGLTRAFEPFALPPYDLSDEDHKLEIDRLLEVFHSELLDPWPKMKR